jgi:phage-related protein
VATQAVFYRDEKGRAPVDEFLGSLSRPAATAVKRQIAELNGLPVGAPPLEYPKTAQIDGPLRELRCHSGNDLYRIFYRRSRGLFVLLHAIPKRSRKIPRSDIALAQKRWEHFREWMDGSNRRGPRPLGKDAP